MSTKTDNAQQARRWMAAVENNPTWRKYCRKSLDKLSYRKGELVTKDEMGYISRALQDLKGDEFKPIIEITTHTTYDEIIESYEASDIEVAVLNFASYFNCGGGFLKGAIAQEESLCHASGLYKILNESEIYNDRDDKTKIPAEYYNEVIYTPGVPFTTSEGYVTQAYLVDVISVAAPNCNRVPIARYNQYLKALRKRIEAIFIIPYLNGAQTLILGAWGCGVFKNEPKLIAQYFEETSQKYGNLYKAIKYAIPNEAVFDVFDNIITKG